MRGVWLARVSPAAPRPPSRLRLGAWGLAAWAFVLALGTAALVVPVGTVLYWLRLTVQESQGNPYAWASLWDAARTALSAASLAALTTTALAFPLAYIGSRYGAEGKAGRWARVTERAAYLGYATPPLACAPAPGWAPSSIAAAAARSSRSP